MTRGWIVAAGVAVFAWAAACATTRIGSVADYEPVAMNKVYPYPTPEERARQKVEVVLAARYSQGLGPDEVGPSMRTAQRTFEKIASEAGANVVDRSEDELKAVLSDLRSKDSGIDFAIVTRFVGYEYSNAYQPPSNLFGRKSEEELAATPGTCTHIAVVEIDVKVFAPSDEVPRHGFTLRNSRELEEEQLDDACPLSDVRKAALLEETAEETLGCLDVPLKNGVAPRGYIQEHRKSTAGDQHIFKTSLGRDNGARPGEELEIHRVQYFTRGDGRQDTTSRQIAQGVITDQVGDDYSWIAVNVGAAQQEILEGDLVRGVFTKGFTSNLGIGGCKSMLSVQNPK